MTIRRFLPKFSFFVFVLFSPASFLLAVSADDWTIDDVLSKVEQANGGIEAIEEVSNLRVRGEVVTAESAYDFLLLKKRPNMVRIHLMLQGRSIENGFDGNQAWRRLWIKGQDRVEALSGADLARTNLEVDFDGPLIGEPMPGETRRFVGVERINRVDYFIVMVESEFIRTKHFIDSRNFREWKTIREVVEDGKVVSATESVYSDYNRHKTIWLAHRIERSFPDGSMETVIVHEAEIDPGILDRAFKMPKQWSQN